MHFSFNWPLEFPHVFFFNTPWKFHVFNLRPYLDVLWNSPFWRVQANNLLIYWKLWVSIEERQRAHPKNYQKMPKIYRNLAFDHLKTVYKMLRPEIFPVFDNIFTANMLRIRKKRGLLPSEPVLQYNCSVKTFLKLMIMIEHIKMIQIHCLDIWSMLLSRQVPHRSNSSHLFWNLKDLALVQILSQRRKITYQLLLIGFFH